MTNCRVVFSLLSHVWLKFCSYRRFNRRQLSVADKRSELLQRYLCPVQLYLSI